MKTITLPACFNHQTAPAFSRSVMAILNQAREPVRVQISDTCKIDSAGVATLLHWRHAVNQRQQTLLLSAIPSGMQTLLELYELTGLFDTDS